MFSGLNSILATFHLILPSELQHFILFTECNCIIKYNWLTNTIAWVHKPSDKHSSVNEGTVVRVYDNCDVVMNIISRLKLYSFQSNKTVLKQLENYINQLTMTIFEDNNSDIYLKGLFFKDKVTKLGHIDEVLKNSPVLLDISSNFTLTSSNENAVYAINLLNGDDHISIDDRTFLFGVQIKIINLFKDSTKLSTLQKTKTNPFTIDNVLLTGKNEFNVLNSLALLFSHVKIGQAFSIHNNKLVIDYCIQLKAFLEFARNLSFELDLYKQTNKTLHSIDKTLLIELLHKLNKFSAAICSPNIDSSFTLELPYKISSGWLIKNINNKLYTLGKRLKYQLTRKSAVAHLPSSRNHELSFKICPTLLKHADVSDDILMRRYNCVFKRDDTDTFTPGFSLNQLSFNATPSFDSSSVLFVDDFNCYNLNHQDSFNHPISNVISQLVAPNSSGFDTMKYNDIEPENEVYHTKQAENLFETHTENLKQEILNTHVPLDRNYSLLIYTCISIVVTVIAVFLSIKTTMLLVPKKRVVSKPRSSDSCRCINSFTTLSLNNSSSSRLFCSDHQIQPMNREAKYHQSLNNEKKLETSLNNILESTDSLELNNLGSQDTKPEVNGDVINAFAAAINNQLVESVIAALQDRFPNNKNTTDSEQTQDRSSSKVKKKVNDSQFLQLLEPSRFKKCFMEKVCIGKGAFGVVFKAVHRFEPGKNYYAIKMIRTSISLSTISFSNPKVLREISNSRLLLSRYVVRYFTWWMENDTCSSSYKNDLSIDSSSSTSFTSHSTVNQTMKIRLFIQMEWCDGETLRQWLNLRSDIRNLKNTMLIENPGNAPTKQKEKTFKPAKLADVDFVQFRESNADHVDSPKSGDEVIDVPNDGETKLHLVNLSLSAEQSSEKYLYPLEKYEELRVFYMILKGLCDIHSAHIIHRDLKPENIFFHRGIVKIGDFGLSCIALENERSNTNIRCGTPAYLDPSNQYSEKSDIYSTGIILLELLCGNFSTMHERVSVLNNLKKKNKLPSIFSRPDFNYWGDLILEMVSLDPQMRPSAKELVGRLNKHFSSITIDL